REMAGELALPPKLWLVTPCAIRMMQENPPRADILSSFHLPDLGRVLRDADQLPEAAAAYLGLRPPDQPWDALTDRLNLSRLLKPALFPLGRWPGPGLHPLTLLQQAAVNAVVRDLDGGGIAAVNGPPGTGKTTLLRDIVAHVMVMRAERLAALDNPNSALSTLDLMDLAIVVASTNNAAVENVSLELPIRGKALDRSLWQDNDLAYFAHTADAVLGVLPNAPEAEHAWGLMAARLGKAENRRAFFKQFWWDADWGLNDWLNLVAWPDTAQNRAKKLGKLAQLDPPLRAPEALAQWRAARDSFRQALATCRRLRDGLSTLDETTSQLTQTEAQQPIAEARLQVAERDLISAERAVTLARDDHESNRQREATEIAKLSALSSVAPSWLRKLFRSQAWQTHETNVHSQVQRLSAAQDAVAAAATRLSVAATEMERYAVEQRNAHAARDALHADAVKLTNLLHQGQADTDGDMPGPGFWALPDAEFHAAAPWNGGAFRAARDQLFIAAMRLHRAFIVAAARTIKPSLNVIAKAAQGGPDAPKPTPTDWGVFFLLVPVVSTTFASIGRMFPGVGAGEIGWLLIDEAGQAPPQAAVGAIWRARRAVVIGDPLQIRPVVTTPPRTTRLIFGSNGADPVDWAAPTQSAQTLADRVNPIQGRFDVADGGTGQPERVTGMPLLVHRRCEQPMFALANRIAYDGRMVFATSDGPSPIRDRLGPSAWIDVDAPSTDKWVETEGLLVAAALSQLCRALPQPDVYVICPFRVPAARLRAMLFGTPGIMPALSRTGRKEWIERRVGTVHTFQGKEAEAVILMLGAGRGARAGSRSWAGATPNLLNVAATRAKRVLYVVGNRTEWQTAGVFAVAAEILPPRSAHDWLGLREVAVAE
ncbi:MAG: DEAD/DEAH box helicase, partial [Janthinobacterium lividum]